MPWCCFVPATAFFEWHAIASYTVLTTAPNTLMEAIRNRMPVILGQSEED